MTAKELADFFEVSERTIYRDIDALAQLKVPIISFEGYEGGYRIQDNYFIPSLRLEEKRDSVFTALYQCRQIHKSS